MRRMSEIWGRVRWCLDQRVESPPRNRPGGCHSFETCAGRAAPKSESGEKSMGKWERQAKHEPAMTALERRVLAAVFWIILTVMGHKGMNGDERSEKAA